MIRRFVIKLEDSLEGYEEDVETLERKYGAEEREERPQEWIPVNERLPKFSGLYLISIDSLVTVMNFGGTCFTNRGGVRVEVDAWQELPRPYIEETDND